MTRLPLVLLVATWLFTPALSRAQDGGETSRAVTASLQAVYGITTTNLMATARMLDDEMYAYRPTDEVRSVGQLLAHVANSQYFFCSTAAGEQSPNTENIEQARTTKDEIVEALSAAFDYCNDVYRALTDETGSSTRSMFGNEMAASAVLAFNSAHNYEHYGNLVTYMRMNGIVPPSSQQ